MGLVFANSFMRFFYYFWPYARLCFFTLLMDNIIPQDSESAREAYLQLKREFEAREASMQERLWLDATIAEFDELLRENYSKSLDEFAKVVLDKMAKITFAYRGGFFIYDEDEKKAKAVAGYAQKVEKMTQAEFDIGEGIVGQAAESQEFIIYDKLPAGQIALETATVLLSATCLLALPLIFNDAVYGVIELVYIQEPEKRHIELIKRLNAPIAAMLESIHSSQRTRELLQESLQRSDELRAAEEELRQNLEELEATQSRMNEAQDELLRQQGMVFSLLNSTEDPIILLGNDYEILLVNEAAQSLFAENVAELRVGRSFLEFFDKREQNRLRKIAKTTEEKGSFKETRKYKRDGGERVYVQYYFPAKREDGGKLGFGISMRDVTLEHQQRLDLQKHSDELQANEEMMRQNLEELEATQEAMEKKQAELERNNKRMKSNEKVLKKAYESLQTKERTLQEAIQAQKAIEEELRQNNEELQATQEAIREKQDQLESQNRKMKANEEVLKKAYDTLRQKERELQEAINTQKVAEEELRQTNEELSAQRDMLEETYSELNSKNIRITDSIRYAKRIQQGILPSESSFKKHFAEHFILFRPKDMVSGDFYWMSQLGKKVLLAVVDCTGHGVPGAFMSLIGYSLLNSIVNESKVSAPAEILSRLHKGVRAALETDDYSDANDGMDLSVCSFEYKKSHISTEFAGAKTKLYYLEDEESELLTVPGDRLSVGGHRRGIKREFTNHSLDLARGAQLYLSTDGYVDAANKKRQKFSSRRLRALIAEVADLPLEKQGRKFAHELDAHQYGADQRDDITFIGLKL